MCISIILFELWIETLNVKNTNRSELTFNLWKQKNVIFGSTGVGMVMVVGFLLFIRWNSNFIWI